MEHLLAFSPIYLAALGVLIATQLADIISTNAFIANGKGEANPTVRWAMQRFRGAWWVPKLAVHAVMLWVLLTRIDADSTAALIVVGILIAANAYAVFVNGRAADWWGN